MPLVTSPALKGFTRFLFRFRGGRWLAHRIRTKLAEPVMIQVDDFDGDLKFNCRLDEHMGSQIYWWGAYSRGELRVLDKILADGMVFVDIGANQGEFSLAAAKRIPNGEVFAFEPLSRVHEMLVANIRANGFANIKPFKLALSSKSGPMPIYTASGFFEDGTVHDGLGTLYSTSERSSEVETVQCKTLDEFVSETGLKRIDVLKLDIEGGEYDALLGATETLKRFAPKMIIELNASQATAGGHDIKELVALLNQTHDLWLIGRSGKLTSFSSKELHGAQNVLCLPKQAALDERDDALVDS